MLRNLDLRVGKLKEKFHWTVVGPMSLEVLCVSVKQRS